MSQLVLAEFRQRVAERVRAELGSQAWFRGACLDGEEDFWTKQDIDGAIEHATNETIYWDGLK